SQRQTVNVPVINNSVYEPPESFNMHISAVTNALLVTANATGRIRDDDVPAIRVFGGSAVRAVGGVVPMDVELAGPTSAPVTVNYATSDGSAVNHATAPTDYTATTGSLTFTPNGALEQTVNVPVNTAAAWKADAETFVLTATNPANAQSATATGTILD